MAKRLYLRTSKDIAADRFSPLVMRSARCTPGLHVWERGYEEGELGSLGSCPNGTYCSLRLRILSARLT